MSADKSKCTKLGCNPQNLGEKTKIFYKMGKEVYLENSGKKRERERETIWFVKTSLQICRSTTELFHKI